MQIQEKQLIKNLCLEDGVLVIQARDGDQQAFEVLYQRYSSQLLNFLYRFVGEYDLACDIVQHTFIQLYLSLERIQTREPLRPWLFQVARNRALDYIRQGQRRQTALFSQLEVMGDEEASPFLLTLPDAAPLPDELAEHEELQDMLHKAIEALPPKFRQVVSLRYTTQMSFSEIARVLNMPAATAKTYFQRAKPLLRKMLMDERV